MEWHINDLSIDSQFENPHAFREALEPLLRARHRDPSLRSCLYCSRLLYTRQVTANADLRQAVQATRDKNYIRLVLEWMAKYGPFWDDERQQNQDDYFEYQSHDVTDQGLGEAARRRFVGISANVFSFQGSPLQFVTSPLSVQQGLPEDPIETINIDNYWEIDHLIEAIQASKTYCCWQEVYTEIRHRFAGLIFPDNVMDALFPVPFSEHLTKRIFELLHVLDNLVEESDESGALSQTGMGLHANHFVGEKAWFTDESANNKTKFKEQLTFHDPEDETKDIFCPWHGKIKTPQIRIHFQWTRPAGQNEIKVVYIGPKITTR